MRVSKSIGPWVGVFGLLFASIFLASCQTNSQQYYDPADLTEPGPVAAGNGTTKVGAPALAAAQAARSDEIINIGDTLIIIFSDTPAPYQPFEIKVPQEGTITLLFNKVFIAAGRTPSQLEREIRDTYVPNYFKNLTVTVRKKDTTLWYYVGGDVKAPARQMYTGPITVTRAIQSAGDFSDFANKKNVLLIRANGSTETINCVKALKDPSLDKEVFPGDKIQVKRRLF
jgi:polysaccharide export outer membrane protein